ncbi:MAG: HEAT repeat domain-containing protein [Elusimicrobia bacterium]|nr:HEAT repeat domain-containing protein [Elusimicrobiota bacterium]
MNMAFCALLLGAPLLARPAAASSLSSTSLRGFDVYGSTVVTEESLGGSFDGMLHDYITLRNDGRKLYLARAESLKAHVESELRSMADLAYADMYYGDYFTTSGRAAYITFDLVDMKDAKARMPFRPAPVGSVADPGGLLAAWQEYSDLGMSLRLKGILPADRPSCPAFYCTWGSATPELAALESRFVEGVEPNKKRLLEVLQKDADPSKRGRALFLLSYLKDDKEVVETCLRSLEDPSVEVRGATLQVLSDIAVYRKDILIGFNKVIAALNDPSTQVRGKALGLLIGMVDNPVYQERLKRAPPPILLDLLKLQQPLCHDAAYTLLIILSKESFDRRDYASWERWLANPNPRKKRW